VLDSNQRELLRRISLSTGELAIRFLSGIERGSIITLSMTIDALLTSEADSVTFLAVRDKFDDLPTPEAELATLYEALMSVCDLAVVYDESKVEAVCASLLALSCGTVQMN